MSSTPDAPEHDLIKARFVCALVAFASGLEAQALDQPRQRRDAVPLRRIAMYLAHVAYGLSLSRVAQAFRCDRSTAAFACRRVEDARDDPAFDARLCALEDMLRLVPAPAPGVRSLLAEAL